MSFKKVLVYVNTSLGRTEAVEHARALAHRHQSELHLMDVVGAHDRTDLRSAIMGGRGDTPDAVATVRERLDFIAHPLELEGIPMTVGVQRGDPHTRIVQYVEEEGIDLVVKTAESGGRGTLFGSTAHHLMRKCPCPVMLVKPSATVENQRVLAAIDAWADDPQSQELNRRILEVAVRIVNSPDDLFVVHAYQTPRGIRGAMPPEEVREFREFLRSDAREAMQGVLQQRRIPLRAEHLLAKRGTPAHAILTAVDELQIDHLVMGSVGRDGVTGLLVGNTAERVFSEVQVSLLVVKPDGPTLGRPSTHLAEATTLGADAGTRSATPVS